VQSLDRKKLSIDGARDYVEQFFPSDEKGDDVPKQTVTARDSVLTLFRSGTGNEGKSRYDLFNGLTEFVDHKRGTRIHGAAGMSDSGGRG